jgi:aspartate kinase
MRVYKFGGSSVQDVDRIKNVVSILESVDEPIIVVVSAMGKTTNAIEQVIKLAFAQKEDSAKEAWKTICQNHIDLSKDLDCEDHCHAHLEKYRSQGQSILDTYSRKDRDELYDQLISLGELMSSTILTGSMILADLKAVRVDAREMIKTDAQFRSANINWGATEDAVKEVINTVGDGVQYVVTQGFIGREPKGRTTTLGREGSDYTAAIISYCMDGESMSVWKDVPGVLTADPRLFPDATLLPRLSYREAIEMTYYGAQVIHPKTIQPIQRKEIPLFVKSFLDPNSKGTEISKVGAALYPPMIVVTKDQYLLEFSSRDFSFIAESHLSMLFRRFNHYRIRVNLMRNTAISFTVCVSAERDRLDALKVDLSEAFQIKEREGLELLTVRNYNNSTIDFLKKGRSVVFEEIQDVTFQMVTTKEG